MKLICTGKALIVILSWFSYHTKFFFISYLVVFHIILSWLNIILNRFLSPHVILPDGHCIRSQRGHSKALNWSEWDGMAPNLFKDHARLRRFFCAAESAVGGSALLCISPRIPEGCSKNENFPGRSALLPEGCIYLLFLEQPPGRSALLPERSALFPEFFFQIFFNFPTKWLPISPNSAGCEPN